MEIGDIAQMLADRIDHLVADILPGAMKEGPEWRCGSVAGERGRSMAIRSRGANAGTWCDFSHAEHKGDALDLVAFVLFAGDKGEAVKWAKSWLGLDDLDPERLKVQRAKVHRRKQQADRQAEEEAEKRRKAAHAIWLNAGKGLAGTLVDLYLLGRGIGLCDLAHVPGSLRFAGNLQHYATKTREKTWWPAMVAAVVDGDGKFVAVHRTFLKNHGGGLVTKAPLRDAKLCLGSYRGGSIALARGASGKKLKDAPEGDTIILCEGIEDGLTIAACQPDMRVHAAVSVSNFRNVRLPEAVTKVILAVDNDGDNDAARRAVDNAVDVFTEQGRNVQVARPPAEYKDYNDMFVALLNREGNRVEQGKK